MNIASWILLGLIAGSVANLLDPAPARGGIIGSIVLGVLGAVIGGWLANTILGFSITGFNFTSLLIAVGGSVLLLVIGRMLRGRSL